MGDRAVVLNFDGSGLRIDRDSLSNLVIAQTKYMFTGVMDLRTKTIYFASLAPPEELKDDHYGTQMPLHRDAFPCKIMGRIIEPIVHKSRNKDSITSHDQLANIIVGMLGGGVSSNDFCGFALRFEGSTTVKLAPTSRTLNPLSNGELEPEIMAALEIYLRPKLALLGLKLEKARARVDPDSAQAARGGAVAVPGLFASLRGAGGASGLRKVV